MAGRVRTLIDEVIRVRTAGNAAIEPFVRAALLIKGIDPDAYTATSADDPSAIAALEAMLRDFRKEQRP